MPAIAESFLQRVLSSGLLSAPQRADISAQLGGDASPEQAAAYLIESGLLTSYQVAQLTRGQAPLVLGQYHILDELGRGGFGCVYKARHRMMDRIVALKVIAPTLVESERARNNFRREVLATTRLVHPNIVMAYDANEVDGVLFFVMEYVDGTNLHQFVRKHGPLSFRLASELLVQAAMGLQYAHEQGLVHRDIKPLNLLIPRQAVAKLMGQGTIGESAPVLVKIVDFGLAQLRVTERDAATPHQSERGFLGTPDYVSPEQARNSQAVDIRSDLYSLGCTLYFALTGRTLFTGDTIMEVVVQHLEKQPTPLEQLRPETPAGLASIVRRLLAKDPNRRFQTPSELIAEMRFFLGTRSSGLLPVLPAASLPRGEALAETDSHMPATEQTPLPLPITAKLPLPLPQSLPSVSVADARPAPLTLSRPNILVPPADRKRLRGLWTRWFAVVEGRDRALSDGEYRELHASLLRVLQAEAEAVAEPRRGHCQRLSALVQPWLSRAALQQVDRNTREELCRKCDLLGQALGLSRHSWNGWLVVLALMLLGLTPGLAWLASVNGHAPTSWTMNGIQAFIKAKPLLSVMILLPSVGAAAMLFLGCRRRH